MKNHTAKLLSRLALLALLTHPIATPAGEIHKLDGTSSLWNPFDWMGGSVPTGADTAVWDDFIFSNGYYFTDVSLDWGGMEIRDPQSSPIHLQLNPGFAPPTTLTLGSGGIDLSEAAADLEIGGGPDAHLTTASAQTWQVPAGRTLTMNCTNDGPGGVTKTGGGRLQLNYDWNLNDSHLGDSALLTLGGGVIEFNGGSHTEIVGGTVIAPGATHLFRPFGFTTLRLNGISRNVGGTLEFPPIPGFLESSASNDGSAGGGILGGWAVAGGDWAQVLPGGGIQPILAYTNYSPDFLAANNVNLTGSYVLPAATSLAINSLRFDLMAPGAVLTIGAFGPCSLTNLSGGVLFAAPNAGIVGFGTNGTLRGPAGRDLVFHTLVGFATNQIVIADNAGSGLTKSGPGVLLLNPNRDNTYTGPTRINEGALKIGNISYRRYVSRDLFIEDGLNGGPGIHPRAAFLHGLGNYNLSGARIVVSGGYLDLNGKTDACDTLTLSNHATLTGYAAGGSLTVTNPATDAVSATSGLVDALLSAQGGLTKTKFGTLTLARNTWVSGPTRILDGTIQVVSNAALVATELVLGDTNRTGKLVLGGTNGWVDSPGYAYVTNVIVASSNVLAPPSAIVGGVANPPAGWADPALIFNAQSDATFDVSVLGGPLPNENNLGLTKIGPGTLTLTGYGNYSGVTSNLYGVLKVGNSNALPSSDSPTLRGTLSLSDGASLDLDGSNVWVGGLFGSGTVLSSSGGSLTPPELRFRGAGDATFAGTIQNPVTVAQLGSGRQVFTGTNTYTGPTRIRHPGTIGLGRNAVLGNATGTLYLEGGCLALVEAGTRVLPNPITVNGWGFLGTSVSYGSCQVEITGQISGGSSEILVITNMSTGGGDGSFFGVALTRPQTFNLPIIIQDSSYPYIGVTGLYAGNTTGATQTFNGPISGPGAFTCGGNGVVILNATNHVFPTFVNGGLLILNGAIDPYKPYDPGYMYVQGSGTLAGNGRVAVPLNFTHGGVLSPGKSIGRLTVSNLLTFTEQSTNLMELSKTGSVLTNDSVVGITTLTYHGTLVLTNVGPTPLAAGDSFKLYSATNYVGAFTHVVPATPGPGLAWDLSGLRTNGTLRVAAAPLINTSSLSGGSFILRGAGGTPNATYFILTSTNPALPLVQWTRLATNAFDAGGSFGFTNAVNLAEPQRFFTLQLP